MGKISERYLERALKASLKANEFPDAQLNSELKNVISRREAEGKTISIWWLPIVVSIAAAALMSFVTLVFFHNMLVQVAVIALNISTVCAAVILTAVGITNSNLKEGALISL